MSTENEQDIKLALLEREVSELEGQLKELKIKQEYLYSAMKTGKGVIIAFVFLLGSGALAVGQSLSRLLGIQN